jgi:hypothetical protein
LLDEIEQFRRILQILIWARAGIGAGRARSSSSAQRVLAMQGAWT